MRVRLLLLVPLVLVGCTTMPSGDGADWSKPNAGVSQTTLDETACASGTRNAGHTWPSGVGGLADIVRSRLENALRMSAFEDCMTGKGYQARRS